MRQGERSLTEDLHDNIPDYAILSYTCGFVLDRFVADVFTLKLNKIGGETGRKLGFEIIR